MNMIIKHRHIALKLQKKANELSNPPFFVIFQRIGWYKQ